MGLKLIPSGQGDKLREYYLRFEGSMYGVLHVDNEAHTVSLVSLKELDNVPVLRKTRRRTHGGRYPGRTTWGLCGCAISPPRRKASTLVRAVR